MPRPQISVMWVDALAAGSFNLTTTGLATGTYEVRLQVGSPVPYVTRFQVR